MLRVIAIGVILLYYWYFCKFESTPYSQPTSLAPPPSLPHAYTLESYGPFFMFFDADTIQWEEFIPSGFQILDGRFVALDACHQQPDGTKILATGPTLYHHLRLDTMVSPISTTFEPNASFPLQQGNVFYFTCQQDAIGSVDMCPPGQVFEYGACQPIDACTGKKPGLLLPNVYDISSYYECTPAGARLDQCPDRHYFMHDSCHSTQNLVDYCRFNDDPRILNDVTVVRCSFQQTPTFETCPPGTALFGTLQCQSTACVGKPDGTRLALPLHTEGLFKYSPGYRECRNERVSDPHMCPSTWDPHFSQGDDLTHLPQVFDGRTCSVPSFCTNVQSDDPDVIVPVHEFTKHVRNWKRSIDFDAVTGYRCEEGRKRKKTAAGQRISKKFKIESACSGGTEDKVVVSGKPEQYFDCSTQTVVTCPSNQFFDGETCRNRTTYAHKYNDIDLFKFNGLSHDGWIGSWNYEHDYEKNKTCTGSESELLSIYNVCSHPECTLYPFLIQVDFSVKLSDKHECVFESGKIIKRPTASTFDYWSQRERMDRSSSTCTVGNNVASGHFVVDSSLFTTCDETQPFVFCPSPLTTGIEKVNGNRFTCTLPDPFTGTLPPDISVKFLKNELDGVFALPSNTNPMVRVNNYAFQPVAAGGNHYTGEALHLESTETIRLDYHQRMSYPPDIAFTKQGTSKSYPGHAYVMQTKKHTAKPVTLPKHDVVACVKDFS